MKRYELHELIPIIIGRITRIALLLCAVLLVGCKTTKNSTKSDAKENSEMQLNQSSDLSSIASGSAVLDIQSNVKTDELINISGNYTKWSKPNPGGKQYIEETGSFCGNTRKKTADKTKTSIKKDSVTSDRLTTDEKIKAVMGVRTKTTEKTKNKSKAPAGFNWGLAIIGAGLLVLLYFILKRFGVIK